MQNGLIQSHPGILMGKPVVTGTRITVEGILEKLAAGETFEQVLQAHPRLTESGILAALDFAAQALQVPDKLMIRRPARVQLSCEETRARMEAFPTEREQAFVAAIREDEK